MKMHLYLARRWEPCRLWPQFGGFMLGWFVRPISAS
jgi:hypothetical protein